MARGPGAGSGSQGLGATWGQVRPHRCRGLMYIYIAIQNDQPHLSRASSRSRYRSPHNRSCRRQPAPDNGLSVPAGARWRMGNGGHQGRLRGGKKENNPPSQGQNRVVTIAIQTPSIACQPPMGRIAGQGTSRPRSHLVRQLVPDHRVVLVPDGLPMRVLEECLAVSTHPTAEEAAPLRRRQSTGERRGEVSRAVRMTRKEKNRRPPAHWDLRRAPAAESLRLVIGQPPPVECQPLSVGCLPPPVEWQLPSVSVNHRW